LVYLTILHFLFEKWNPCFNVSSWPFIWKDPKFPLSKD
jgi:hypothetical protein